MKERNEHLFSYDFSFIIAPTTTTPINTAGCDQCKDMCREKVGLAFLCCLFFLQVILNIFNMIFFSLSFTTTNWTCIYTHTNNRFVGLHMVLSMASMTLLIKINCMTNE